MGGVEEGELIFVTPVQEIALESSFKQNQDERRSHRKEEKGMEKRKEEEGGKEEEEGPREPLGCDGGQEG